MLHLWNLYSLLTQPQLAHTCTQLHQTLFPTLHHILMTFTSILIAPNLLPLFNPLYILQPPTNDLHFYIDNPQPTPTTQSPISSPTSYFPTSSESPHNPPSLL